MTPKRFLKYIVLFSAIGLFVTAFFNIDAAFQQFAMLIFTMSLFLLILFEIVRFFRRR